MDQLEKDYLELRLADQAFFKQSLEEKSARLQELETEIHYLRRTLNDLLSVPRPQVQAQSSRVTAPLKSGIPDRWKV